MEPAHQVPEEAEKLIYLAGGGLAAILLGMALVPLRGVTVASNFTFPFVILTFVVAEFGGRVPAVATALISALSLDFFLTEPYLKLTIAGKHDLIAFLGLAACGLVAAAIGSGRRRQNETLSEIRRQHGLLRSLLRHVGAGGPGDPSLVQLLDEAIAELPVSALALRDIRGNVVVFSGNRRDQDAAPLELAPDTLLPVETAARSTRGSMTPLPEEGARLALSYGGRRVGWLEVWGNGRPAGAEARRSLSDLGRLLALWVTAAGGPITPDRRASL